MLLRGRHGICYTIAVSYYKKPYKHATKGVWYYRSGYLGRSSIAIKKSEIFKYLLLGDDLDRIAHNHRISEKRKLEQKGK